MDNGSTGPLAGLRKHGWKALLGIVAFAAVGVMLVPGLTRIGSPTSRKIPSWPTSTRPAPVQPTSDRRVEVPPPDGRRPRRRR